MNSAHIIPLALALVAIVAVAGYAWGLAHGRRMSDDLTVVAIVALIASCSTVPKAADAPAPVSVEVKP